MTNTAAAPALTPEPVTIPEGSPASIQLAAVELMRLINAGSVDADSFAGNVGLALTAMGVDVPPPMLGMIANAVRQA